LKRTPLKGSRLCVIVDRGFLKPKEILKVAREAIRGGADVIQIRDKKSPVSEIVKAAMAVKRMAGPRGVPVIVNDRIEAAVAADADGLHIGQGDLDIKSARRILGKGKVIGVSVGTFEEARRAKSEGADYLGVGPIFKTPVKGEKKPKGLGLVEAVKRLDIPFFAIGGIDFKNARKLAKRGFRDIAVIRAVCRARNPAAAVKRLKEILR